MVVGVVSSPLFASPPSKQFSCTIAIQPPLCRDCNQRLYVSSTLQLSSRRTIVVLLLMLMLSFYCCVDIDRVVILSLLMYYCIAGQLCPLLGRWIVDIEGIFLPTYSPPPLIAERARLLRAERPKTIQRCGGEAASSLALPNHRTYS